MGKPERPNDYPKYCKRDGKQYYFKEVYRSYDQDTGKLVALSYEWICSQCGKTYGMWVDDTMFALSEVATNG